MSEKRNSNRSVEYVHLSPEFHRWLANRGVPSLSVRAFSEYYRQKYKGSPERGCSRMTKGLPVPVLIARTMIEYAAENWGWKESVEASLLTVQSSVLLPGAWADSASMKSLIAQRFEAP